jgi:hypothetical protein
MNCEKNGLLGLAMVTPLVISFGLIGYFLEEIANFIV